MLCAMMNAQQQIATLVHDGNIRVFYGNDAFVNAHRAAVSGDAISLSAGIFNSANITKNLTIRGAGCTSQSTGTHFANDIHIKIPKSDTVSSLHIEGIEFRGSFYVDSVLRSPTIMKCYVNYMCFIKSFNGMVISSVVEDIGTSSNYGYVSDIKTTFINSIIGIPLSSSVRSSTFYNCIIACYSSGFITSSSLESSIILAVENSSLPNSNLVSHCVGNKSQMFVYHTETNSAVSNLSGLFVTAPSLYSGASYPGSKSINNIRQYTFELTDSAKTTYVDANGSQVGIYGGAFPFTDKLGYPKITKMQVGKKATADGKLSVDIEVTPGE